MNHYERAYGTDWDGLDRDAAIERAYALGVAASLGETHAEELEAILAEMDTAYDTSVVELAFEEGRTEGLEADAHGDDESAVWSSLVEGGTVTVDPEDRPGGAPGAVEIAEALDRPDIDSTDALDLPEFLERD